MSKLLYSVMFIAGLALVILGQKNIGPSGLMTMLLGMVLLISLLWLYNRKYQ
ncbi:MULTISPECIES: DUF6903 family protein [unclassified Paenibacillus]|uniref:DUF6903 family protein n=1 Tax=unclassified Paenibacillus TaxID=185978 RepID=UPI002F3FF663